MGEGEGMSNFTMRDDSGDADPEQMLKGMKRYASETELSPCPECGCTDIKLTFLNKGRWKIAICKRCGLRSKGCATYELAKKEWNDPGSTTERVDA